MEKKKKSEGVGKKMEDRTDRALKLSNLSSRTSLRRSVQSTTKQIKVARKSLEIELKCLEK